MKRCHKFYGMEGRRYHWNDQSKLQILSLYLFSCSVTSDSLWSHGLQHTRLPYPSPTPGACSNSCPSSQWCHPNISSSVIPFSSCLQSFPASGSFQMSQFITSDGQSVWASASASVLPVNIQNWFPLDPIIACEILFVHGFVISVWIQFTITIFIQWVLFFLRQGAVPHGLQDLSSQAMAVKTLNPNH